MAFPTFLLVSVFVATLQKREINIPVGLRYNVLQQKLSND
jgi:hypothetical protein